MISVNEPLLDGNEKKYLQECIDTGWISSEGPFVKKFEQGLANRVNRKYGIAVSNGTAAIDIAIDALGIGSGDEVIMPCFTIISCIGQLLRIGAKPVLVDSDPRTYNMDVSQIEEKITSRTKAIMVVHIYGLPVDMNPVLDIANRYNLRIIEDAAEMHGQTYMGKPCGSFGDISTFSFYPNKLITTGEGGMLLTDNKFLAEDTKSLRNLCFKDEQRFVHDRLGWNYRMTNMQAALGVAQLERLDDFIIKKRNMGKKYSSLLSKIDGLQLPLEKTDYAKNIFWVYGLVLRDMPHMDAKIVTKRLTAKGVGCRPFFYPMHKQPISKKMGLFKGESYPIAENLYKNGFYIPSGLALTDNQIEIVANILIDILS